MKRLFLITMLVLFLTGCANTPTPTPESTSSDEVTGQTIEIVGGNEESLREFISRWLTPLYPVETPKKTVVTIGGLPEDLPLDLPMPEDARIAASVTGEWADYVLIVDTGLSPEAAQDFYAKALVKAGWQTAPTGAYEHGFVSQAIPFSGYCLGEGEAFLNIGALQTSKGTTDLRLNLFTDPDEYMCREGGAGYGPEYVNLIPPLQAPKGALVQGGGSGASDSDAQITANLKTELTAAELAAHYNRQLETAGWEMITQGDGEGAAWSTWSLKDEQGKPWSGTLIILETAAENNNRYALIHIERNP